MRRSPGPVAQTVMRSIDIITEVPREASLTSISIEIIDQVERSKIRASAPVDRAMDTGMDGTNEGEPGSHNKGSILSPQEINLAPNSKLQIYLKRLIISGKTFKKSGEAKQTIKITDTNAVCVFSTPKNASANLKLLQAYSKSPPTKIKFVPFELQKSDPNIFGKILYNNMKAQEVMRNVAICGISPTMMGFTDVDPTTLKYNYNIFEKM